MNKKVEYRPPESDGAFNGEGFYIRETGEFIAPNTLGNVSDERIEKQAEFYTEMVSDIEKDLQTKAKAAFLNLAELGITAYYSKSTANSLSENAKGLMSAGKGLSNELDLKDLLKGKMTGSLKKKAKQFGSSIAELGKEPLDKGTDFIFNDWALEASSQNSSREKEKINNVLVDAKKIKEKLKANAGNIKGKGKTYSKLGLGAYNTVKFRKFYKKIRKNNVSYKKAIDLNDCNIATAASDEIFNQIRSFITVWAPAINKISGREKYDGFKEKSLSEQKRLRKEFKKEVKLEIKYQKKAAQITELIMILGFILIVLPLGLTTIIGVLLIIKAQSIADRIVKKLKVEDKEKFTAKEYVKIIWDSLKGENNFGKVLGAKKLFIKLSCGSKKFPLIQEMRIEGPNLLEGVEAFIKDDLFEQIYIQIEDALINDTKLFDRGTYSELLKKELIVDTEFKAVQNYYGALSTISKYLINNNESYIKQEDIPFIGFIDSKQISAAEVMNKLVANTFNIRHKFKNRKYEKYSFKQIIYKLDFNPPRLIHAGKIESKNCINQLIITSRKGNYPDLEGGFPNPKSYLEELKEILPEKYLQKLLNQNIQVGYSNDSTVSYQQDIYNNDYCYVFPINILNIWLNSQIDLEDKTKKENDNLDYHKLLSTTRNNIFINNELVGKLFSDKERKYDYIIIPEWYYELQTKEHRLFFKSNYDILQGSKGIEKDEGDKKVLMFWTDIGSSSQYKLNYSIKKSKIKVNNELIGKNLIRAMKREDKFEQILSKQKYIEKIDKEDGRILEIRYVYDLNGSLLNLFKPQLTIKYTYSTENKWDDAVKNWNVIVINNFKDLDYGIDIPDIGATLVGSYAKCTTKQFRKKTNVIQQKLEKINLEELTEQARGKIKKKGTYLKAENLKEIAKNEEYKIYIVSKGDTLWKIAKEFLGAGNRWSELEKEDGSSFNEREIENLKIGTEVYIAKKKLKEYKDKCKYCRIESFEVLIDYLQDKIKRNSINKLTKEIKKKLNLLKNNEWNDIVKVNDFLEFIRGYNMFSQLLNDNCFWDYKDIIKSKYGDWSCDLDNELLYPADLWFYIYYGYLGKKLGLSSEELKVGIGIGNLNFATNLRIEELIIEFSVAKMSIKDCVYKLKELSSNFNMIPTSYWQNKFGTEKFESDLETFQIDAIKLGISLWEDNTSYINIKRDDILKAIISTSSKKLNKRKCNK